MRLRPVWSTELIQGQPGLHRETLSWSLKKEERRRKGKKEEEEKEEMVVVKEAVNNFAEWRSMGREELLRAGDPATDFEELF